jgi:hypothetical protein
VHWKYGKRWGLLAGVVSLLVSMAVGAYVVVRGDISVTQMMGGTDAFYIKPVSSASVRSGRMASVRSVRGGTVHNHWR